MAESLHCSFETIKTLIIGYIPIQNKKFKKLLTPLINNKLIDTVFIYWESTFTNLGLGTKWLPLLESSHSIG